MAEIKVNVTAGKQQKVTVSSTQNSTEISASADTGRFWAQTAKNWAVSDVIVDNTDYSSKHYAKEAKENATTAKNYESTTRETYNSFLNASANALNELKTANEQSLENIESSKLDAVDSINTVKDESISNVENKANEALILVNNGIANINTTKNTAVDDINATKTNILKDIEFVAEGEKEEIQELAEKAKDDIESTGFYMRDDKLYFINSKGEEEEFKSGDINNKITNCLLEVPQNIKLELNNGTLTLKAGSVVTVPNGKNTDGSLKFDYVTIEGDVVAGTPYTNAPIFVYYYQNGISQAAFTAQCSGTTPTTAYGYWYDTVNNFVKRVNNYVEDHSGESLPIAIVNASNGSWASIDQVFNGMGYIGSTVWVDKGVKGLIPNGRNEDGTLNNREDVTPKVYTVTDTGTHSNWSLVLNKDGLYILSQFNTVSGSQPTTSGPCYTIETNKVYNNGGQRYWIHLANFSTNAGVFTNLDFKLPFRAVDYNDISNLTMGMPDYSAGVSKSNNVQYTAETNGFLIVELGFGWQFTLIVNGTSLIFSPNGGQQGWKNTISFLIKKGSTYKMDVVANGFVKAVFYPMT